MGSILYRSLLEHRSYWQFKRVIAVPCLEDSGPQQHFTGVVSITTSRLQVRKLSLTIRVSLNWTYSVLMSNTQFFPRKKKFCLQTTRHSSCLRGSSQPACRFQTSHPYKLITSPCNTQSALPSHRFCLRELDQPQMCSIYVYFICTEAEVVFFHHYSSHNTAWRLFRSHLQCTRKHR